MLRANELHLEHDDRTIFAGSFELAGPHALIVGAPAQLFSAALHHDPTNERLVSTVRPVSGARVGAAPTSWTVLQWLEWRLRLSGLARSEARSRAREGLRAFRLEEAADRKLRAVGVSTVRALPWIAATQDGDGPIYFDDPEGSLADTPHALEEVRASLARFVERCGARPWVGFLPTLSPWSPLAAAADEVLVVQRGEVLMKASPATLLSERPVYIARVFGTKTPWSERCAALGVELLEERAWPPADPTGKELRLRFAAGHTPRDLFGTLEPSADDDVIVELFSALEPQSDVRMV